MIKRFENQQEYQQWLKWESFSTKQKAAKFREKYGDIIPIVIMVDAYTPQGGEWAPGYIFIHPQAEELLRWVIVDENGKVKDND